MADRFFADDYARSYWKLSVQGTSPAGTPVRALVSCNCYLINAANAAMQARQAGILKLLAKTQSYGQRHPDFAVRTGAFGRTRVGKGSPADMEYVLQCGILTGAIDANQAALQQWADRYLGCDCTGFASAYCAYLGLMSRAECVDATCNFFRSMALRNNAREALIWDFDRVGRDDLVLWMNESGAETKYPGHIAVVYGTRSGGEMLVAESSGADDGAGHRGPRLNVKRWGTVSGPRGHRTLAIGEGAIVVRVVQAAASQF